MNVSILHLKGNVVLKVNAIYHATPIVTCRWGLEASTTFNHLGGSCNLFMATTGDVWIIPSFLIWQLFAACWAQFMCHHDLWPTSGSHPFSSLNSSLGYAGGYYYPKITIPIFRLILEKFAFPGCFSYCLFYLSLFLTFFRLVCYCSMWLFQLWN